MIHVGDIVRVTEDSMHFDMLQDHEVPLEGLCIKIDPHEQLEKYLVEFSTEYYILHDGGERDEVDCRFWIDKLEVLELNPNLPPAPQPAPAPPPPQQFQVPPRPERRAGLAHVVEDHVPEEQQVWDRGIHAQWGTRAEVPNENR